MSDEELMQDEYEFEYEDEEEPQNTEAADLEIIYYDAKNLEETDVEKTLKELRGVVTKESVKGKWGFKALKKMIKILWKLGRCKEMLDTYKELLSYTKSAVTRNESEKAINSILDFIGVTSNTSNASLEQFQEFYEVTLESLQDSKNDRLWFKTNMKLGGLWLEKGEFARVSKVVRELYKTCQLQDGSLDMKKGTQLLEIFALEIQMHTLTKNTKRLKELYHLSLQVKSAIPHPRILGLIRECGGKMWASEGDWEKAQADFFDAFMNYDEAGSSRKIQCLKYLVLASMLSRSSVNPFDAAVAKVYQNDPQIIAMTALVNAYSQGDIKTFEKTLSNSKSILEDPFLRLFIEDLLRAIRTIVLVQLVKPYSRIKIPFISKELNISENEVESLLVSLILDSQILGKIDQVNHIVFLDDMNKKNVRLYSSIDKWCSQLGALTSTIVSKLDA